MSKTFNITLLQTKEEPDLKNEAEFLSKTLSFKKIVVFSPHLDDSVLSMASMISFLLKNGLRVRVINIFTKGSNLKTPLTQKLLTQSDYSNTDAYFNLRKKEDKNALAILGDIQKKDLDFVDAAWRQDKSGKEVYYNTTLGQISKRDDKVIEKVTAKVKSLEIKDALVFAPIAQGKHADHQITRDVCQKLFTDVIFYLDFPYSEQYAFDNTFVKQNNLKELIFTKDFYQKKSRAILKYKSQIISLFGNKKGLTLPLEKYFF